MSLGFLFLYYLHLFFFVLSLFISLFICFLFLLSFRDISLRNVLPPPPGEIDPTISSDVFNLGKYCNSIFMRYISGERRSLKKYLFLLKKKKEMKNAKENNEEIDLLRKKKKCFAFRLAIDNIVDYFYS